MVAHTGATGGPGRPCLTAGRVRPFDVAQGRPLNRPRPLRVEASEDDRPAAVYLSGRRHAVEAVLEAWRIDDDWWRERSVSRLYYSLLLEDGRRMTVYRDLVNGRWLKQAYAQTFTRRSNTLP
jgi:hypothetical protein